MKRYYPTIILGALLLASGTVLFRSTAAGTERSGTEYLWLHWDGRDHTHAVGPDGQAIFFREQFSGLERPRDVDERAYYMSAAINILAQRGFEVASSHPNEILMRR